MSLLNKSYLYCADERNKNKNVTVLLYNNRFDTTLARQKRSIYHIVIRSFCLADQDSRVWVKRRERKNVRELFLPFLLYYSGKWNKNVTSRSNIMTVEVRKKFKLGQMLQISFIWQWNIFVYCSCFISLNSSNKT